MRPLYFITLLLSAWFFQSCVAITATHNRNFPSPVDSTSKFPSMDYLLSSIETSMGIKPVFEIKAAEVNNMEARLSHRKKQILYNPEFVRWINKSTRTKWALVALIAHEMGHHLLGHTRRMTGSRPPTELEADEYAGKVLRKMGATLSESQEVMLLIASSQPSKTHPGRLDRLMAIRDGWEAGQ